MYAVTARSFNDLLRKIQQGDMSALEPIYSAYYKSMCNQALWIVHSKADAEDVASEAMMKLIRHAQSQSYEYIKDGGAFIHTLTRNTALDFLRKNKQTVELDDDIPVADGDGGLDKLAIYDAMKNLSDLDFKIAELFYYYDCKIGTIAEDTRLSVSAVKWHLSEIRKKLYEILKNT